MFNEKLLSHSFPLIPHDFTSLIIISVRTQAIVIRQYLIKWHSGEIRDWNESSAHPEGEGFGVRHSRGSLPHDQEGRLHQEASREEQKGRHGVFILG